MKIRKVIEFLEHVERTEGDINLSDITGFWTNVIPSTGEKVVEASVGDGMTIRKLKKKALMS